MAQRPIDTLELKIARRRAGLTQKAVANRVHVARNTVSRLELGMGSDALLLAVSRELNVSVETLYKHQPGDPDELSNAEREIVGTLRELNERGQFAVKNFILGLRSCREYQKPSSHGQQDPPA